MTPKQKAKELVDRYLEETPVKDFIYLTVKESSDELLRDLQVAKQCALICVEEQIKLINDYADRQMLTNWATARGYWEEVKQEIKKL